MTAKTFNLVIAFACLCGVATAVVGFLTLVPRDQHDIVTAPAEAPERAENPGPDYLAMLTSGGEEEQLKAVEAIFARKQGSALDRPAIFKALENSKFSRVRTEIAAALGKADASDPGVSAALAKALASDHHFLVRLESAKALRALWPDEKPLPELALDAAGKGVSDPEEAVALESMRLLFDHPSNRSTKPLLDTLARPGSKSRWKAIEVLGRIRDPSCAPALLAILQDDSTDLPTRSRACAVLGLLKHEPALPVIRRLAGGDPESELTKVAMETLSLFK